MSGFAKGSLMDELKPAISPEQPVKVVPTLLMSESTDTRIAPLTVPDDLSQGIVDGPQGVGWGFLLYLATFAVISKAFSVLVGMAQLQRFPLIWSYMTGEFFSLLGVLVAALFLARLEGRPFAAYGLPKRGAFGKLFWLGMLWGIVAIGVLMVTLRVAGGFSFGGLALGGPQLIGYAVFWIVFFTFVGLFEEFLLRGYAQFTLARGLGFWPTAIILSTTFGAIHLNNKGENWVGALGAALIGLFFCLTLRRTGDLWFAVGLHASWDWGETYLFSVPNSGFVAPGHLLNPTFHGPDWLTGGTVGPEASVFVFILMALMFVVFHLMYREKKYLVP